MTSTPPNALTSGGGWLTGEIAAVIVDNHQLHTAAVTLERDNQPLSHTSPLFVRICDVPYSSRQLSSQHPYLPWLSPVILMGGEL